MRAFIGSHPNISIPAVGSNMWTYFYRQYGDLGEDQNFERCLHDMLRYKHVRFLEPDEARIRAEFTAGERTYANLFSLFLVHYAERQGKSRWGAQTGLIERYAAPLFAAYPDLRVIHMIRDPRDRYEASLARWPEGKGRAGGAAARFSYSARLASANLDQFGADRYRIVRFEDMITQPEDTVRGLCEFLGEQFDPVMMTMPDAPELRAKLGADEATPGPVILSSGYIGRYREGIPPGEADFIERAARRRMRLYGYLPSQAAEAKAVPRRVRATVWPGQGVRYLAWMGHELVQQRFPRLFRRRHGARMMVNDSSAKD
jgi:hypothetical protein